MGKKLDILLVVRGDHNDADYIIKVSPITQKEIDKFTPLLSAIKKFKPYKSKTQDGKMGWSHDHNWPCGEYGCREDLGEKTLVELYGDLAELAKEFDELYVPHAEGWNLHTIHEIYVVKYQKHLFRK